MPIFLSEKKVDKFLLIDYHIHHTEIWYILTHHTQYIGV